MKAAFNALNKAAAMIDSCPIANLPPPDSWEMLKHPKGIELLKAANKEWEAAVKANPSST